MRRPLMLSVFLALAGGCTHHDSVPREGFVNVTGGRVWYHIAGSGKGTPLLLLHGGPGMPSYYLKPLEALGDERPVIFYDQLGAGRSDRPADTTLWTNDRFVSELAQVRTALHLDQVHILGHSWGTMLLADYMLTDPKGVRSLILASPALSTSRWLHDADSLKRTLPPALQQTIAVHEKSRTYDAPEYQAAVMEYYHRFLARRLPWSAEMDSTFAQIGMPVYLTMWGPSEFTSTGSLKSFERAERLKGVRVPTLFTAGRYDEARPETVRYYQSQIPGSELIILENSAHMTMQDEPERYVEVVRAFLRRVDNTST